MPKNPLVAPTDGALLTTFLSQFGLAASRDRWNLLRWVARTFACLPYENLTKVIKIQEEGSPERARREPKEVLGDHFRFGTGGTCFSLSATLLHLVRSLGWKAAPILADRKYGDDTHSAIIVWINERPHLLDPGYLIVDPIPLDIKEPRRIRTSFNELILIPQRGGEEISLHTVQQGNRTYRLTFKTQPVEPGDFLKVWDSSFKWDMMQYLVLTCIRGQEQHYLQGTRFQIRNHDNVVRREMKPEEMAEKMESGFGIDREVVARAMEIMKREI